MAKSKKKKNNKKKAINKNKKRNYTKKKKTIKNNNKNNNTKKNTRNNTNKKEKNKSKKNNNIILIIIVLLFAILFIYSKLRVSPTPIINNVYIDDNNNLVVNFSVSKLRFNNKIYCYYSKENKKPSITDSLWEESKNNSCMIKLDTPYYIYLKNEDNEVFRVRNSDKVGKILNISLSKNKIYLPIEGNYKIDLKIDSIGYINDSIEYYSEDENIANVKDGIITAINTGSTKIHVKISKFDEIIEVIVTNLITERPKEFDYKKAYLPCNKYSESDNDLIDEILKERINDVGYKTRAATVEATRFLTLDFPYRINYFYENGRQTTNNVDGEGRYYHVGFYLHSSRFKNITGKQYGPKTWGCSMYDRPAKRKIVNGLDCSGFVSWALLNAGFDVKDAGAGWSDKLDLTDYGTVKKVTTSLSTSNTIRVGDLLHSEKAGGHIGIIVGIDNNYYYIAQALWYNQIGVIITKRKKSQLSSEFPHVVLMDKYYNNDGNLTNMW